MIKVSDYITRRLVGNGITDVFMITGGGAMFLNDSVGRQKELRYVCPHHEQAAAIAAEGYFRASGKMAAVVVTSGPGGTNALTGVIGQWLDSVPCLYLSGQVKQETTIEACRGIGLRQLGDQEINIVDIVRPVTKYAEMVRIPQRVRWHLEKALHLATTGRPGPVWLDIPLDVQAAMIDEGALEPYIPEATVGQGDCASLDGDIESVLAFLRQAQRPVFLAGQGIRLADAKEAFIALAEKVGVPVLTSFCGYDLIPSTHPLYAGRPGTLATRFGNFTLQNADLLICIGTRNNIRQVSYNWKTFGRSAKKIVVDIDRPELAKPTSCPDLPICADAKVFIEKLSAKIGTSMLPDWSDWREWCLARRETNLVVLPEYMAKESPINPYVFIQVLTEEMPEGAVCVAGNGTACVALFQAGIVKKNQRVFWNSGCASMGYDLPAAVGACFSRPGSPVVCLAGDGSLQMNIQELQTVAHHRLPMKLFVLNNEGYASIKQTQSNLFNSHFVGCGVDSGVSFPALDKLAEAYGLQYVCIERHASLLDQVRTVLATEGPVVCEVRLQPDQRFAPRVSSARTEDGRLISKPLEDMYPFLSKEELKKNMIVDILEEL